MIGSNNAGRFISAFQHIDFERPAWVEVRKMHIGFGRVKGVELKLYCSVPDVAYNKNSKIVFMDDGCQTNIKSSAILIGNITFCSSTNHPNFLLKVNKSVQF